MSRTRLSRGWAIGCLTGALLVACAGGPTREPVRLEASSRPEGPVRLSGRAVADDSGEFLGLGASLMWAAWGYRHDRPFLEAHLRFLADAGFDYIRALGVVGDPDAPDFWDGREIDWRWPDYEQVIAGLTDLAYDRFGLRVEWTLIGDGQLNTPAREDRERLIRTFVQMARERPEKIMHFEVANEAWQNGFSGAEGLQELRELTVYLRNQLREARLPILVAASAPFGTDCADYRRVYSGGVADLATIHFDRGIDGEHGAWGPVREPWRLAECSSLPIASNNEPIGPGSSVASDHDPYRILSAAIVTYLAGLPLYVYHTDAGVRGDRAIWDMPDGLAIRDGFEAVKAFLPPDLPNWARVPQADSPQHPFGPVTSGAAGRLVDFYASRQDRRFLAIGIGLEGVVAITARRALRTDVLDPTTGVTLETRTLEASRVLELPDRPAVLLKGEFLD